MCGRYTLFAPSGELAERFGASFAAPFRPRYNAAPGQSLPVIADRTPETIVRKEWGFVPPWADRRGEFEFINARAETLTERPTFRAAFEREGSVRAGRCLVPADGFYEWVETEDGTRPYRVSLTGDRPFAMAGLWARWQPETTQTGLDAFAGGSVEPSAEAEAVETFAVVTTEPNDLVADLHHRMAAILPRGEERRWLRADPGEARELLGPYPAGEMRAYPVSRAVNDPANDRPELAERLGEGGRVDDGTHR